MKFAVCDFAVKTLFWFQVPPALSGHCEHWAAGYSLKIVWNKPPGVWTAVEVNVSGRTLRTGNQEEQHLTASGFQPAATYQVSLTALSGTVRRSEPSVFLCHTDPRGKSGCSSLCCTHSKQRLSGPMGTPSVGWNADVSLLWSGVIAGSAVAVLLVGVLICIAVFIYYRRPKIRLVLPLWLTHTLHKYAQISLFFTNAGKGCSAVAPNSRTKSQSKSIPVSGETSDIVCAAS